MCKVDISIIIPVYNVEAYISKCLTSVRNQTFNGLVEVIFVDDQGSDNSIQIVKDFLSETSVRDGYTWKIVEHDENKGLSAARNTGLKEANGEYVFFLDSDDYISENCLELLFNSLCNDMEIQCSIGDYELVGNVSASQPCGLKLKSEIYDNAIIHYCNDDYYTMVWNKLFRKDFIINNNLFFEEGLIHEDNLWTFCVSLHIDKFTVVNENTYNYVLHDNSISQTRNFEYHQRAYQDVLKKMITYCSEYLQSWNNNVVYEFILKKLYTYFMYPFWQGFPQLSYEFYSMIRETPSHNPLWVLTKIGWHDAIISLHQYMPHKIGFKYYHKAIMCFKF